MNYNHLLSIANQAIGALPTGTKFESKDLFNGAYWNKLSKDERITFGKMFKNAVK